MFIRKPASKIPARMFLYGASLGSLASGMTIGILRFHKDGDIASAISASGSTLSIGLFLGGVAGLVSGIAMLFILKELQTGRFSIRDYRIASGILTVFLTCSVFSPAFCGGVMFIVIGGYAVLFTLFLWVLVAVICSQITITKYLRESDIRKRKVK